MAAEEPEQLNAKKTAQEIYKKIFDDERRNGSKLMPDETRLGGNLLTDAEIAFLREELLLESRENHIGYANFDDHYEVINLKGLHALAEGTRPSVTERSKDFDALPKPGCSMDQVIKDSGTKEIS